MLNSKVSIEIFLDIKLLLLLSLLLRRLKRYDTLET